MLPISCIRIVLVGGLLVQMKTRWDDLCFSLQALFWYQGQGQGQARLSDIVWSDQVFNSYH